MKSENDIGSQIDYEFRVNTLSYSIAHCRTHSFEHQVNSVCEGDKPGKASEVLRHSISEYRMAQEHSYKEMAAVPDEDHYYGYG